MIGLMIWPEVEIIKIPRETEMEANGQGLVDFWAYVSEKGLMPANTAGALRGASKEVLSAVQGEGWETLDLREIDVEDFNERFARLRAVKFKPDSLQVYRSRFKNAVSMYLEFLENPTTWRYKAKKPYKSRVQQGNGARPTTNQSVKVGALEQPEVRYELPPVRTIDHQYPLRPNLIIKVQLPVDLTDSEATKLSAFVTSLVQEPIRALPAPAGDQDSFE
jgi:hypothetical protein